MDTLTSIKVFRQHIDSDARLSGLHSQVRQCLTV
jgi:hypothetical protein